jgi:hypothetical protein
VGLVLPAPQVRTGRSGQLHWVGRIRLRRMAFDVAVEQFYGIELGTIPRRFRILSR